MLDGPSDAAVQQCTTSYAQEPRDVIVAFRMTRSLSNRISSFQSEYHKKSRTDAMMDLLKVALFITENAQKLGDPEGIKYLRANLYNVQLVDDITEWPQDRIEAILGALVGEKERRLRIKLGRHLENHIIRLTHPLRFPILDNCLLALSNVALSTSSHPDKAYSIKNRLPLTPFLTFVISSSGINPTRRS